MKDHNYFLERCLDLAQQQALLPSGGPFAALVVKNGEIIAEGCNRVTGSCDPTAHAEMVAIRKACTTLQDFQLSDCIVYSSCEPCPMCLGAIFWARPKAVYYAATRAQAAAGFDDSLIYEQIVMAGAERSIPFYILQVAAASEPFALWKGNVTKTEY